MSDTAAGADLVSDDEFLGLPDENPRGEPQLVTVPEGTRADRLDKVLAGLLPDHSRSRLQGWIEAGNVHVNGAPGKVRQTVGPGDEIAVWPQPAPEALAFAPEPVEFAVVDESADWIVVNKPAGLVTHPGAGNWSGTLLNGLLYRYPELAHVARAGIVHRLDKDTSGLMVVARNETAQTHLVRQLQARSMGREYMALAHGWLAAAGKVDRPIGRDSRVPVRMSVERPVAPKPAITRYAPARRGQVEPGGRVTEVVCRLETGRTHQIRVHLASLGHPLLADTLYGGKAIAGAQRQMLHARALHFDDPGGRGEVEFAAAPPADMTLVQESIAWNA
ncbi:Ribosomal large subunit pseudouridine synthase D [Achromobacter denitrificans]|uniref:RluA family pseudouridine synthase n=1 Tax=Achromobacter denitrificans TaxID=32002 RepID=UPI000788FC80|nr:RluA family pseudouridine synthase [Achromobacter denitrificans]OLU09245.1 RNA pseudouridine synthase [Achromobacter denitrificans]QKH45664.1 RluA family pseudouridine synthase [Achromobacter denitrificans]QKH52994.1 RluA family pseudouridine synthase [Achromobacter denitrificans]CAB3698116.1 Ribosomal large subunit pseudouridine synthase D [Achromobacter denitrificans]SUW33816.1 Ribosomal large subunit pseudouridine synthase D [Achromobacter denitrificans]